MFKSCNLLLFLGLCINICMSAPAVVSIDAPSLDSKADTNRLTSESNQIKASLNQILSILTSDKIVARRITDSVIILQQVLKQNANPALSEAVVKSLLQIDHEEEEDPTTMRKLMLFLNNLKDQISFGSFPVAFSNWLNNHILVIQNFVTSTRITTTTETTLTNSAEHHINPILDEEILKEKVERFKLFIQDGLQNLVRQETLNNIEVGKMNRLLNSDEFDTVLASMIVDQGESESDDSVESSSQESLNLVQALKQVYERASPDLQSILQSVLSICLRALETNGLHNQQGSP